jgi:predicted secreted protein/predicted phosphodiesterase
VFRIAITGDISCSSNGKNTVNQIANQNPSLVLWLGDLSYVDSDVNCFISQTSQLASKDEAIIGNHDDSEDGSSAARAQLINHFGIPSTGYYSKTFDVAGTKRTDDILLVGMDTQSSLSASSPQYKFVENTLKSSNSPLKIIMVHKPFLTCTCEHPSNGQLSAYHSLFGQYGVDLVLQGHNHNIQYFNSIDNVKYIVSGAGGKSHYSLTSTPKPTHYRDDSNYGFTLIDADFATYQIQGRFFTNAGIDKTSSHFIQTFYQNSVPTAHEQSVTVIKNTEKTIMLTGGDPDNDPITYSITTQPLHGTISIGTGFSYIYTPDKNYVGSDSFTFKTNDGFIDSNAATVSITVQNTPPTANDMAITVDKNTPKSFSLTATDPNGDPLTYTILTPPSHGIISPSLTGGPSQTYVPTTGHVGSDSFTFKTNDGLIDSNAATVSITVQNTPPTANDMAITVDKNTPKSFSLTATDPNGDPLTYVIVTPPSHGTLSPASTAGSSRTYTPSNNYIGSDIFTFNANDGTVDSNTAKVNVNVQQSQIAYNYAPSFLGTGSNYQDTPDSASLRLTQFSLAAWFKTSADFTSDSVLVNKGGLGIDNPGQNMNYGIWMTSTEKIKAGFETNSGSDQYITSMNSYNDNRWHYVVVTNDGSNLRLYIDGVQVGTKALSGALPENTGTKPVRIGANSRVTPPGNFFTGELDEIRVWNVGLTAQQVTSAFSGTDFATTKQILYLDFTSVK